MGTVYEIYKADKSEKYELGKGEWFAICKDSNIIIFKMNELWTPENLTQFVRKALSVQGGITEREAQKTAADILQWCGDDRIVMIPDTFSHIDELKELGIKTRRHRQTGSRWSIYNGTTPDKLSESERADNEEFRKELFKEQHEMWAKEFARMGIDYPKLPDNF